MTTPQLCTTSTCLIPIYLLQCRLPQGRRGLRFSTGGSNLTYAGEVFDTRNTQGVTRTNNNPTGLCGVPFGYAGGLPSNLVPLTAQDALAQRLTALYPAAGPVDPTSGNNFLANPVLKETRNNFDIRVDQKF